MLSSWPPSFLRTSLMVNAFYLITGFGLESVMGLGFWVLATRLYSAHDVGVGAATIAAMGLLATLATLGLDAALIRYLPKDASRDNHRRINTALIISGLIPLALVAVFLLGVDIWTPSLDYLRDEPWYAAAFVAGTGAWTLILIFTGLYVGTRRARFVAVQGGVFGATKIGVLAILVLVTGRHEILLAWSLALVTAAAVSLFVLLPRARPDHRFSLRVSRGILGEMLGYSLPNHVANLALLAPTWVLPLMVLGVLGPEESAYLYVAWTLAWIILAIAGAVSLSLTAEGSFDESRLVDELWHGVRGLLLFLLPAVILLILAAKQVLGIFGEGYSQNAVPTLRLLSLAVFPAAVNLLYIAVKRVEKKLFGVIALPALITLAALGSAYVLMDEIGLIGVAWAWLGAQGMGALFSAYTLWRMATRTPKRESVALSPAGANAVSGEIQRAQLPSLLANPSRAESRTRDD